MMFTLKICDETLFNSRCTAFGSAQHGHITSSTCKRTLVPAEGDGGPLKLEGDREVKKFKKPRTRESGLLEEMQGNFWPCKRNHPRVPDPFFIESGA
jgi:hypothetical protein